MLIVATVITCVFPTTARASGDIGCSASWKLRHPDFTGCDGMAMLSPGNDTRINLVLLLARAAPSAVPIPKDEHLPDPMFDWATFEQLTFPSPPDVGDEDHAAGEGSRCLGDAAGKAAFAAAVATTHRLGASEKTALIAARRALRPTCTLEPSGDAVIAPTQGTMKSEAAKEFVAYLNGAKAFYAGDFDGAITQFSSLVRSNQPWLRETAHYMLGRVEVNRAQIDAFDQYGYRDDKHRADPNVIAAADVRLRDYLKVYPDGCYARSARGLLRRVYWLAGDTPKLAAEYIALFAQTAVARGLDDADLAEEIDNKLLPQLSVGQTNDPTLLAVLDLQAMRASETVNGKPAITSTDIEAQRPKFARAHALFDYLLATYSLYVANDPRAVLKLIPDAAQQPSFDTVEFSRQMLRGMALDATGDPNTRGLWLQMIKGAAPPFQHTSVELALALHDERTAGLDKIFAANSPVHNPTIRDILLTNVADAILLRRLASDQTITEHERAVALFTLLYKDLTRGRYADFVSDLAAHPAAPPTGASGFNIYNFVGNGDPSLSIFTTGNVTETFACPALRDTAQQLIRQPTMATAQLCIAEFVRLNALDGFFLDTQPPADELGGTKSRFPGRSFSRLDIYQAVIADRQTSAADRAYALFRAVNCYAPSRNNSCGGEGVPPSVRKSWFQRLHKDYATSRWAQDLAYYW